MIIELLGYKRRSNLQKEAQCHLYRLRSPHVYADGFDSQYSTSFFFVVTTSPHSPYLSHFSWFSVTPDFKKHSFLFFASNFAPRQTRPKEDETCITLLVHEILVLPLFSFLSLLLGWRCHWEGWGTCETNCGEICLKKSTDSILSMT